MYVVAQYARETTHVFEQGIPGAQFYAGAYLAGFFFTFKVIDMFKIIFLTWPFGSIGKVFGFPSGDLGFESWEGHFKKTKNQNPAV